ncbi:hypothetical protein FD64_15045, partial [Staphylococcus aureus]
VVVPALGEMAEEHPHDMIDTVLADGPEIAFEIAEGALGRGDDLVGGEVQRIVARVGKTLGSHPKHRLAVYGR